MADIQDSVRAKYGDVAKSALSNDDAGVRSVAQAFGYSDSELAAIPAGANMGLSCGNPTAMASLRPGEVVLDLGCGGGLDVFLAASKVRPNGKAIGIDMTPEMIARARKNAAGDAAVVATNNVEFHVAAIERLPLADDSIDVVISNCVLNLVADKPAAFREIFRVLKVGGRLAVSDIALKKALPLEFADDLMAYIGCIAGAVLIEDYASGLRDAGFEDVRIVDSQADLNAYAAVEGQSGCCSPAMSIAESSDGLKVLSAGCCGGQESQQSVHGGLAALSRRYDLNDFAASAKIFAIKRLPHAQN